MKALFIITIAVIIGVIGYGFYLDIFVYTGSSPTRHDRAILDRAETGDANAQYLMGMFLTTGRQGIESNKVLSRQWFQSAAAQNHAGALYRLGDLYRRGDGVARDINKAIALFRKALNGGDHRAENSMGDLYRGGTGVGQSYKTALYWYRRAAQAGNAPAQRNLGFMATEGLGMIVSYRTAFSWYRKAAEQGDTIALNNLGIMYEHGEGVKVSPVRAWSCYYAASLQSYKPARRRRDAIETRLSSDQRQRAREVRCLSGPALE